MSKWDVYRDAEGNAVTITEEQCVAIRHAVRTWAAVVAQEKQGAEYGITPELAQEISNSFNSVYISKSCLMGRMLYQGRPPLDEAPPVEYAAPAYHLTDPELCPECGGPRKGPRGVIQQSVTAWTDNRNVHQMLVTYCDGPHE